MSEDKSSKKHAATAHKKKEARKKGNVAKSQDIGITVGLLVGLGIIIFGHNYFFKNLKEFMIICFESIANIRDIGVGRGDYGIDITQLTFIAIKQVAILSLPVLMGVAIAVFIAQLGMVGFLFTTEPLKPKFEKINPMKGIKKWFAIKSLVELMKSLFKIGLSFGFGILVLKKSIEPIATSVLMTMGEIMAVGGAVIKMLYIYVVILFLVIAIFDYMFQRWQHAKDLKMSDKEMKDEYKQQEGDPYLKAKRRQIHQQVSQQQASADHVPQSDVVVINPTELAIAIVYNPDECPVPYVVAKGETRHADEIRTSAKKNGVPVVRNKPLARSLFEMCEVGDIVPADLYQPVAEILAYVFSINESAAQASDAAAISHEEAAALALAQAQSESPREVTHV